MTAQIPESLVYLGERLRLCSQPLDTYLKLLGPRRPRFAATSTALWRGYIGAWRIEDDRLMLVALKMYTRPGGGWVEDDDESGGSPDDEAEEAGEHDLRWLFPGVDGPVFADWYSGVLRATRGQMLRYVHAGYASLFEEDIFFSIHEGRLQSVETRRNEPKESEDVGIPPAPRPPARRPGFSWWPFGRRNRRT